MYGWFFGRWQKSSQFPKKSRSWGLPLFQDFKVASCWNTRIDYDAFHRRNPQYFISVNRYSKQVKLAKQVPSYYSLPSYHIKILCNYKRYNSDTILYPEPFSFYHHPQFSRCQRGEGLWLLQCVPRGMRLVQRCVASMCRWPTRCGPKPAGVLETES